MTRTDILGVHLHWRDREHRKPGSPFLPSLPIAHEPFGGSYWQLKVEAAEDAVDGLKETAGQSVDECQTCQVARQVLCPSGIQRLIISVPVLGGMWSPTSARGLASPRLC